ncbi:MULTISPECIES: hypothetical protein [unclassified Saccharibacter]|uniref:hypothetical protein n=1 Tax=unclassified Saccharibacter TaxID=2648722 RepID=UPI001354802F|nr:MULTISPECIES: hypothetical protein [unclassified Saccharibacter]MXV58355.1 hypothetical protein [Saccharibacter sp. EH70]MXV65799.1 hypothetical protein [Saccharibacter sp. EH60]
MKKESKNANAERRVYLLPKTLLGRIRAYQAKNKIPTEVEAARKLLHQALEGHDTIEDVLYQCREKYKQTKNLRAVLSDILSFHVNVTKIEFIKNGLIFYTKNGEIALLSENFPREDISFEGCDTPRMQYVSRDFGADGCCFGAGLLDDSELEEEDALAELQKYEKS